MFRLIFILLIAVIKNVQLEEDGILCSDQTCPDYINENPCASLPDKCTIQNSTYNGIFFPSPDSCNCCDYCLENLDEGDYCANGELGGLIPSSICGPGLYCDLGVCKKRAEVTSITMGCSAAQRDYDERYTNGGLGKMEVRPDCDDNGFYQPYKCVPGQTCFCLDKDGNRIFGEIAYTSAASLVLKCECSRKYNEVLKFFDRDFLYPNQFFRCTENGDYDTIQCIGDKCMCTDASDGAPTFPTRVSVNISEISETSLKDCFKKDEHETGKYYHDCAEKYLQILEEIEEYKKANYDTVFDVNFPNCDLNGKYAPVQKGERVNEANVKETFYFCAYSNGSQIEDYEALTNDNINCKCARSRLLLHADATEKPECCKNGNFNPVQCRRGKCYCVDEDGYQTVTKNEEEQDKEIEVDIDEMEKLFCYSKKDCKE